MKGGGVTATSGGSKELVDEFDGEALKVVGGLGEVVGVAWLERECGEGCGLVGAASALLTSA